ncbi:MAG: hypothetical protein CL566_02025 [Alphaproteobacteria bacterium]|jgi:hypothetical protein|nr:hypothetical protein [Alphaproteobacteria bacterium]
MIVIILGVLILIVLGAVIWTAFDGPRNAGSNAGGENTQIAPDHLSLGLPSPDCVIEQARTDGGRLTVITGGPASLPDCRRVFVIQLSSGRIQAEIRL